MSNIEAKVESLVIDTLKNYSDFELIDVEYVKERDWYLRIFIDKPGGIGLDDCQNFSEEFGKILDKESIISGSYILEVSSPGLDRLLKKEHDFVRERGKKVDVTFYAPFDGNKQITGVLAGFDGNTLTLEDLDPIPMDKVASVRLHIDF